MPFDLNEIKKIRKKYGLTQSELAKFSGVSQSLIAKIESGRLDPTYSKAQKIFDALNSLRGEKELKALNIMNKKIISIYPNESIKDAIKKMRKYEISQMPIVKNNNVVGIISEGTILDSLTKIKSTEPVEKIMEEAPPIITKNTPLNVVSDLLKHFPILLVSEKGNLIGVITKSDLIEKAYK